MNPTQLIDHDFYQRLEREAARLRALYFTADLAGPIKSELWFVQDDLRDACSSFERLALAEEGYFPVKVLAPSEYFSLQDAHRHHEDAKIKLENAKIRASAVVGKLALATMRPIMSTR